MEFVNELSIELKLEFPNMKGLSPRNLRRMRIFYNQYKNIQNWPMSLANFPCSHNYTLIEKIKDKNVRMWYAEKGFENGWSHTVLVHQIESNLYTRQKGVKKLANFDKKMSLAQKDVAKKLGTTHSTISAYEIGKTLILTSFIIEFAELTGTSID